MGAIQGALPRRQQAQAGKKPPRFDGRLAHRYGGIYARCVANGSLWIAIDPNPHVPAGGTRVLCPVVGEELLAADNNQEGAPLCKGLGSKGEKAKGGLLASSLTASSGADWVRMRPSIERAMGGGLMVQRKRHERACAACAELALEMASRRGRLDARALAAACAARGMAVAAAGADSAELEVALHGFFKEDLLARHKDDAARARLRDCTTRLLEQMRQGGAAGSEAEGGPGPGPDPKCTLAARLLGESCLSPSEVQDNLHSGLIAGFQAAAVLLLFSVLELAARPDLQEELRAEAKAAAEGSKLGGGKVVAAVLRETLRVYPPVSGLPRYTTRPVELGSGLVLPADHYVTVDLIAHAHAQDPKGASWTWEPLAEAREEAPSSARPFGLGPRGCPAGNLTLALVGRVLHSLALSHAWSEPRQGGGALARCCGRRRPQAAQTELPGRPHPPWLFQLLYSPTLAAPVPIEVEFSKR